MSEFTPLTGLAGGLLIGASAVLLLGGTGRLAGISNIAHNLIDAVRQRAAADKWLWRLLFLLGMIGGTTAYVLISGHAANPRVGYPASWLVIGGFLVGYGTSLGNGCTSGHGVCGLGRLSLRSLAATLTFMATGAATVLVIRHLLPL